MKTKQELLQMLFARLAELQDLSKKPISTQNATLVPRLQAELALLYDILGEEVSEEYWEQIEEVI